jgi:ABC-type glycerol-3-phosphate transport system substrate-binding protein
MSFDKGRATSIMLVAIAILLAACHHHNNKAPRAAMSVSQPSADQVTTYASSSAGSEDPDGQIATQYWDFSDGASSAEASPAMHIAPRVHTS